MRWRSFRGGVLPSPARALTSTRGWDAGPGGARREEAELPLPVRATTCGLPAALSAMLSVPVRAPVVVGEKVTLTLQAVPAGSVAGKPHVLVWAKSPEAVMVVIPRLLLPVLLIVTTCGLLEAPTDWLPNTRLVGQGVMPGAVMALPERSTKTLPPGAVFITTIVPCWRDPALMGRYVT